MFPVVDFKEFFTSTEALSIPELPSESTEGGKSVKQEKGGRDWRKKELYFSIFQFNSGCLTLTVCLLHSGQLQGVWDTNKLETQNFASKCQRSSVGVEF